MRGDGDGWVIDPDGSRYWGIHGAAGLLLRAPLPDGSTAEGTFSPFFLAMGRHRIDLVLEDLIPVSVIFLIVIGILVWIFLEMTRHGRLMYAIGSNERAASLTGTNVNNYKIMAYMISGTLASVGGMLLAARLGRGDIASGTNLLLDAVAAALIGYGAYSWFTSV